MPQFDLNRTVPPTFAKDDMYALTKVFGRLCNFMAGSDDPKEWWIYDHSLKLWRRDGQILTTRDVMVKFIRHNDLINSPDFSSIAKQIVARG